MPWCVHIIPVFAAPSYRFYNPARPPPRSALPDKHIHGWRQAGGGKGLGWSNTPDVFWSWSESCMCGHSCHSCRCGWSCQGRAPSRGSSGGPSAGTPGDRHHTERSLSDCESEYAFLAWTLKWTSCHNLENRRMLNIECMSEFGKYLVFCTHRASRQCGSTHAAWTPTLLRFPLLFGSVHEHRTWC